MVASRNWVMVSLQLMRPGPAYLVLAPALAKRNSFSRYGEPPDTTYRGAGGPHLRTRHCWRLPHTAAGCRLTVCFDVPVEH